MAMAFVMAGSCVFGALAEPTDSQAAKKPKLKTKSVSLNVGKKKTIQITGKRKKAKYIQTMFPNVTGIHMESLRLFALEIEPSFHFQGNDVLGI